MTYRSTIDNDSVAALEAARFGGRIVIVDKMEDVEAAYNDLKSHTMIGFDTETRPSFRAGVSYKVGLLQLSTPDTCYLIRLSHIRLDNRILKILGSRQILKVGADVSGDIRALHALRNFNADGFVDLQVEASRWGIEEKSLRKLSAIVLNKRVSKAQRLSNWEAESLTPQQQEYAATDAWICPEILKELQRVEPKAEPYTIISVTPTPSTSQPQQRHKARHHRRHAHHHSSNKQHIE
ncbi:MAG: 3'-5' exonuclease domain-containing protein 2 [Alistipes sp.]|nr:3'-5' exonuclease domain-containing protein 2 [Alistipes sp.]